VRIGDPADGLNSDLNAFVWDKRANHQYNQPALGKAKLLSLSDARLESLAINTIRDKPAIPAMPVSFKEVWIYADQTIAAEETKFGLTPGWWPIAVVCDEYVTRTSAPQDRPAEHPIGKRITTSDRYIIFGRMITKEETRNECQFFIAIFISQ
jgi:hypothetical protein